MGDTSIQWTDKTWNPVTGCTKVSAGCKNCYAEKVADRFWKDRKFTDVVCHEDRLEQPLRWRKPVKVFVNSMSDLFHEDVPRQFIHAVFMVMAKAKQHTFQVLTKRPERMFDLLTDWLAGGWTWREGVTGDSIPNVWLGVSVEDQKTADERIPVLQRTPAAIRFVSYEPALGQIDITEHLMGMTSCGRPDWLIVGGESGPSARPFDLAWAIDIVRQCKAAGTAVFVKQFGGFVVSDQCGRMPQVHFPLKPRLEPYGPLWRVHLKDSKGGDMSEWPEDLRVRQFPPTDAQRR